MKSGEEAARSAASSLSRLDGVHERIQDRQPERGDGIPSRLFE